MTAQPNAFVHQWDEFYSTVDDIAITLGLEPVDGDAEQVRVRMPLRKEVSQPTGMFAAPALFGLADITGTFLAIAQVEKGRFPLAVQSSINIVANTHQGYANATARLVRSGRTLIVTQTDVCDDEGALMAAITTTYVVR